MVRARIRDVNAQIGEPSAGYGRRTGRPSSGWRHHVHVTRVRFDGQTFLLDPAQDVAAAKEAVVTAAREGADFVDFRTVGHGVISLLITAHIPVRFETVERSAGQLKRLEEDPPPLDRWSGRYDY